MHRNGTGTWRLSTACVVIAWCFLVIPGVAAERNSAPLVSAIQAMELGYERLVVRVGVQGRADVDRISSWLEAWEVDLEAGVMIVGVDWQGYQRLIDLGFEPLIDWRQTERINRPFDPLPGQEDGIPGFPCYRTVEETLATGAALEVAYPTLAQWLDIGDSWEKTEPGGLPGYDLMVLRLTNQAIAGDKPVLWVEGSIHPRELVTAETVTRFGEYLLANYGLDPNITWILDQHEVQLLLLMNPDGRKHAETGLWWRKNTNENYCSPTSDDRGADLNRNFDFYWGCCGGSSSFGCDETYRGPDAASEPESQAVQNHVASVIPDRRLDDLVTPAPDDTQGIFIDVHSYGEDVFMSWGFQSNPPPPNADGLLTLGRKFSYFTGYEATLGSYGTVDGSTKDWAYGRLGIPAYTFELGTEFFQECAPFESTIYPDNLDALIYAAKSVGAPYTAPFGPDVATASALPNVVAPGEVIQVQGIVDDTRFEAGSGQPTQNVAAAELYVDELPWEDGAIPIPMTATDGSFNGPVEEVSATLDSTGLADGRHTLYLRGRDVPGDWGVVTALFVWVLDPATAAHVAGEVVSAVDGTALDATVSTGPFITATDPADGAYDLLLPAGIYDLTARAEGFAPLTAEAVTASGGATTALDFELEPFVEVLADDVEGGNIGWTTQPQWAITSEASNTPTHSWTDSPGGEYGNDWNTSLTSPALDFTDLQSVTLEFFHIYDIESGYDYGHVQYSTDGGINWTTVASYTGTATAGWEQVVIDLAALDGVADGRIRFRLETDGFLTEDGWHLDDIVVRAAGQGIISSSFADGFESGDTSAWSTTVP